MTKQDRINEFIALWQNYSDEENDDLIVGNNKLMDYLENEGFFTAPASTKYHGAYEGGLFDHSKQVFLRLQELTEKNDLEWERPISPFIVGFFHDLCKCDQYLSVVGGEIELSDGTKVPSPFVTYTYNQNTLLKGHGTKTLMILSQFINLTEEEMLCIRYHMGPYGNEQEQKDEWAGFDKAIKKTNGLCLWAHLSDMLASKVDDV